MKVFVFLVLMLPIAAYAADDEAVRIMQNQLSMRIGEEMNKAIQCEIGKELILKDADAAQDELQDAGD